MTILGIRAELRALASPGVARSARRFFRTGKGEYGEGDRFLGVSVPVLRRLARQHRGMNIRRFPALLRSHWHEERLLAALMLVDRYARGAPGERAAVFRLYLGSIARLKGWDVVDSSAPHILGAHLFGRDRSVLRRLAASANLWRRRAAMLATLHFIRRGDYRDALAIAEILLDDREDLIHKAAGWMLREIGERDMAAERSFLRRHAARMPRTMLRYAIEGFPARERSRYLRGPGPANALPPFRARRDRPRRVLRRGRR